MLNCVVYTHFDSVDMGSDTQFLYQKFVLFVDIFYFSVSTYFFPLFDFFKRYLIRFKRNDRSSADNSNQSEVSSTENSLKDSIPIEPKTELQPWIYKGRIQTRRQINFRMGLTKNRHPTSLSNSSFQLLKNSIRTGKKMGVLQL
ncbi:hypothetical protein CsSME_00049815 [Camellia sinensis var. sinensis]